MDRLRCCKVQETHPFDVHIYMYMHTCVGGCATACAEQTSNNTKGDRRRKRNLFDATRSTSNTMMTMHDRAAVQIHLNYDIKRKKTRCLSLPQKRSPFRTESCEGKRRERERERETSRSTFGKSDRERERREEGREREMERLLLLYVVFLLLERQFLLSFLFLSFVTFDGSNRTKRYMLQWNSHIFLPSWEVYWYTAS